MKKKIIINPARDLDIYKLINIQTGDDETSIITAKEISLNIEDMDFGLRMQIRSDYNKPNTTKINTYFNGQLTGDIPHDTLVELFAEYAKIYKNNTHAFDHIDLIALQKEVNQRYTLRQEVLKQEELYKKKLLRDEMKRLAKENVDALKPPLTSMLPNKKKALTVGGK